MAYVLTYSNSIAKPVLVGVFQSYEDAVARASIVPGVGSINDLPVSEGTYSIAETPSEPIDHYSELRQRSNT